MVNLIDFTCQYGDDNNNPLSGGSIECYESGTSNPKAVYNDVAMTSSAGYIVTLNSSGKPNTQVFLGIGRYSLVIKDVNGTVIDVLRDIDGQGSIDPNILVVQFTQYCPSLRSIDPSQGALCYCFQYDTNKETQQAGAWFKYNSSSTLPDDGGMTFNFNNLSIGRWERLLTDSEINPYMFGCYGNTSSRWIEMSTTLQTLPNGQKAKLVVPRGNWELDNTVTFVNQEITFESGAYFFNSLSSPISFIFNNCTINWETHEPLFDFINLEVEFNDCHHNGYANIKTLGEEAILDNYFPNLVHYHSLCNVSNTPPELLIDSSIECNAQGYQGGDLVLNTMRFVDGGKLMTNMTMTINNIIVDAKTSKGIFGETYPMLINIPNGHYHWEWFENIDGEKAKELFDKGDIHIHFDSSEPTQWLIPSHGVINPQATLHISQNNKIWVNADNVFVGNISSDSRNCIVSEGKFPIVSSDVNVLWFDVSYENLGNAQGLINAISMASYCSSNLGTTMYANGSGGTFKISSMISDVYSENLNLCNIKIIDTRFSDSITLGYGNGLVNLVDVEVIGGLIGSYDGNTSANLKMYGVKVQGSLNTNIMYLIGNKAQITNSEFQSVGTLVVGHWDTPDQLLFSNNITDGCVFKAYTLNNAQISNNSFRNLPNVGSVNDTSGCIQIYGGSNTSIVGNTFEVIDGHQGNNAIIKFNGATGSFVAKSLVVTGNSFVAPTTPINSNYYSIRASGYTTYGHTAKISNNSYSSNIIVRETKAKSGSLEIDSNGNSATIILNTMFPRTEYPTDVTFYAAGLSSYIGQVGTPTAGGGEWDSTYAIRSASSGTFGYFSICTE